MDFFQNIAFKESNNIVLKKSQSNDKLSWKATSSSYHME